MRLKFIIVVIACTFINLLNAQTFDFGNVPAFEISNTKDDYFKDAPAVILYYNINYNVGREFEVHIRIKIYSKEGFENANFKIPYNNVSSIKASTYNIVDGDIQKTDITKDGIFKNKIIKGFHQHSITFPNVSEGSVLELKYRVKRLWKSTIYTQDFLPIKTFKLEIKNPNFIELNIKDNPYVNLPIKTEEKNNKVFFVGKNIPSLKEEIFVGNINNHRGKVLINVVDKYKTWKDVSDFYYRSEWFGRQLRKENNFLKETVDSLIENDKLPIEKAKSIYSFVKESLVWNEGLGLYSKGIKKAYKDKEGNIADINLLLISMYKYAGLKANPMLISTKQNGWVLYPRLSSFNAVICVLEIQNKTYLLDASSTNGDFGEIPIEFNNGNGLVINYDGTIKGHSTMINEKSKRKVLAIATLDIENLSVKGKIKEQHTKYFAWRARDFYKNLEYEENKLKEVYYDLIEIKNLNKINLNDLNKPVKLSYDFKQEDFIEVIGDKIYFEPLLFLGKKENDFNDRERKYPIDVDFPFVKEYVINYKIPEGYVVESLPINKNIKIIDNIGELIFNIDSNKNEIQASLKLSINSAVILADYYDYLYTLFNEYSNISNSKIVLKKA